MRAGDCVERVTSLNQTFDFRSHAVRKVTRSGVKLWCGATLTNGNIRTSTKKPCEGCMAEIRKANR